MLVMNLLLYSPCVCVDFLLNIFMNLMMILYDDL